MARSRRLTLLNFPKGTLFTRVNEVDALVCPDCNGQMRIKGFQGCPTIADKLKIGLLDGNQRPLMALTTAEPIRSPSQIGSTYNWTGPSTMSRGNYYIRITTMDNAFSDGSSVTIAEPAQ